ncbi:ribonuclease T2 [Maribius pontilimi]|uniref:Ribonuclease T2 n=1 Tax=Palleronia pontilimi TaxID=1964209 RepID=A0A934MAH2_9RHOB|nr:ribonuclease T2 [Palleronia pontilimi]MBJ3763622.1 ribonuclease T2 [Palleronia pontilimi]
MLRLLVVLSLLLPAPLRAQDRAGAFDYYVLALSWSPTWCAMEGDARGAAQCDAGADFGWVLHGLWPQYERGYPQYCTLRLGDPSRRDTAAMADIMGGPGAAWYQWKKHGRCAGLASDEYFALARDAFASVARPQVFRDLAEPVKLPARVVEEAFLKENAQLFPDALTVTCKSRRIQEVRVCLTRDLAPRRCGDDVIRDCTQRDALMDPIE